MHRRVEILLGAVLASTSFAWPSGQSLSIAQGPTAYEHLLSILEPRHGKSRPANVEDVLQALPQELLSNFTFVYASRSPHRDEINPRFPRVVLFTTDGKLLLAFTGNPRLPGYNRLEAIHFDDRTSSFHTSRFILGDAIRRQPALKHDALLNGKTDQFECTRCHGADVRPLFDSYGLWPGWYGSRTDSVARNASEKSDYLAFLADSAKTGVYQYLRFPPGSSTPPYEDGLKSLSPAEGLRLHPNARLGYALTPLNWRRIVRKLIATNDYHRLQYPLLSGMLGCSAVPISAAFDERIRSALEVENTRRFERAGLAKIEDNAQFRMQELVRELPRAVSEIAYVAKALGLRRADWSMSLEPSSLGFFDGILTRPVVYIKQDLLAPMLRELALADPEFAPYYNPSFVFAGYGFTLGFKLPMAEVYGNTELCALLADRGQALQVPPLQSVERIDERDRAELQATPPPMAALRRCAACHEGSGPQYAGVEIPFTDPVALRLKLRSEPSLASQKPLLDEILARISPGSRNPMPPLSSGAPLGQTERRELVSYLSTLAR